MNNPENSIFIRPMQRTDLPEVAAIEGLCHSHPWSEDLFLAEMENPVAHIDVLERGGRIAGFLCSWLVAGELEIQDVATAPSYRRQGVAAALLEHLLERGRGEGAVRIILEVRVGNTSAIGLYRRFGFRDAGRRKRYYPDGEDALLMELPLPAGSAAAKPGGNPGSPGSVAAVPIEPAVKNCHSADSDVDSIQPGVRCMKNYKTIVLANQEISSGTFRMRILTPGFAATVRPGQFVMVRPALALPTMLRRPFGVFRLGCLPAECEGLPSREYLEILYKVVGEGTRILSELHQGDRVELLGPLGQGFDLGAPGREKILVGGGIGLVPLFMLGEALIARGDRVRLLMGGRSRDDILAVTEFERSGVETYVSTDDGSLGEEGFVTRVLERKLAKYPEAEVFACGPMPMLSAVATICRGRGVALQVSLEAHMACGVGACLGCVVKGFGHSETNPRYLCTCKAGPVFNSSDLDWGKAAASDGSCAGGGCK